MKKSIISTCHMDFALISTEFVRWGCNFEWSITMHMKCFRILLTNLRKCLEKMHFLARSKYRQKSPPKRESFTSRRQKYFVNEFLEVYPKLWKNCMCIVVLHVKLQPQRTKSVEIRAKFVWLQDLFNVFFLFFNFWDLVRSVIVYMK